MMMVMRMSARRMMGTPRLRRGHAGQQNTQTQRNKGEEYLHKIETPVLLLSFNPL